MHQLARGILISLEGIDGSGKSTLGHALTGKLKECSLPVVLTKEPGGSNLGKKLRILLQHQDEPLCPQAEYLLFAADRAEHFAKLVIRALEDKSIIISDRMGDSSIAYQGYGRGLDIGMIKTINNWTMQGKEPDLVFYLKLPPEIAQERVLLRNQSLTTFEQEHKAFIRRLSYGFDELFSTRVNVITLDATLSIDTLKEKAFKELMVWIKNNNLLQP